MSKSQTAWSNSTRSTDAWLATGRTAVAWASNNTKNATAFTAVTKGTDSWSNESVTQIPYTYDSPTVTYDNAYSYDYINPQANQTNNKKTTAWASV